MTFLRDYAFETVMTLANTAGFALCAALVVYGR